MTMVEHACEHSGHGNHGGARMETDIGARLGSGALSHYPWDSKLWLIESC